MLCGMALVAAVAQVLELYGKGVGVSREWVMTTLGVLGHLHRQDDHLLPAQVQAALQGKRGLVVQPAYQ